MKVLIEAQHLLRKHKGGMDRVILNILNELEVLRIDIDFVIVTQQGSDDTCLDHLPFEVIKTPNSNYLYWEQVVLPRIIKEEKPDLVHFTSNTASLVDIKIPFVLTVHDLTFVEKSLLEILQGSWSQILKNVYQQIIFPSAIKQANGVITVSQFEKANIENMYPDLKPNVRVVYNGVSELFGNTLRDEYSIGNPYFIHLGNTDTRKNTKGVIEAFVYYRKKLNGRARLFINGISNKRIEKFLKKNKALDLKNEIVQIGYIEDHNMPFYYHDSLALLFPSFREGFGMPPLEAMKAGTCVLTSRNSSIPEVCNNAACYVDASSAKEIAKAMFKIEDDLEYRYHLIAKGKENVKLFKWSESTQKVLSVYDNVLNGHINSSIVEFG